MHIVITLSSLGAGGAERVVALLASHWSGQGHRVTLVTFDNDDDPVFHDLPAGVRRHRLGLPSLPGAPAHALRRILALRGALQDLTPDLVVSFLFKINVITLLAATGLGIPVIVAERNHPARQRSHWLWPQLRALLYPRAAALVLQTDESRKSLPAAIARAGIVIPNPITRYPRTAEPGGRKLLAAVGRLDTQKGFDLLINAFSAIAAAHPDWDLVIWGEGPRRTDLEAQVHRLGLADRIRLPGLSATAGAWIASASAFVLSSRFEGFANVLGEAMAAGLPAVAFNCEYGVAVLAKPGIDCLVVPPEDAAALAAALDRLLADQALRSQLGVAACHSAARFSPAAILKNWDCVVDNILPLTGTITAKSAAAIVRFESSRG